jgi:hypothetical protein
MMLRLVIFVKRYMKDLGLAFIGGAFVLFALAFEALLTWKISNLASTLWILSLLLFVFGTLMVVVDIIHTWGDINPRQRKRDERLRTHFDDMKKASPDIIPTLKLNEGEIYWPNDHPVINSADDLPKFPPEFIVHFPQENNTWNAYCSDISTSNKKYVEFIQKIKEFFELSGLKVINSQTQAKSPCIYEAIYYPLFAWWVGRFNHWEHPQIDFTKFNITNSYYLNVSGSGGGFIAYFENEADGEKCKDVITRLALNADCEKESANLISSANDLVKSVSDLKSQIITAIQNIDNYWPGTKEYKFKKRGQCPICKKIT